MSGTCTCIGAVCCTEVAVDAIWIGAHKSTSSIRWKKVNRFAVTPFVHGIFDLAIIVSFTIISIIIVINCPSNLPPVFIFVCAIVIHISNSRGNSLIGN